MIRHYVEYVIPGSFFNEYSVREIKDRNKKLEDIPNGTVGFRFYDCNEEVIDGKKMMGVRENISPMTYVGRKYTLAEVKKKFPELTTLISNMKSNGWNRAVKTIKGNWQPLEKGDKVIANL